MWCFLDNLFIPAITQRKRQQRNYFAEWVSFQPTHITTISTPFLFYFVSVFKLILGFCIVNMVCFRQFVHNITKRKRQLRNYFAELVSFQPTHITIIPNPFLLYFSLYVNLGVLSYLRCYVDKLFIR